MKFEVLMATMFFEKESPDFLKELNLGTDIIIGNQCDYDKDESFDFEGNRVLVLSRNDRGVGKNRNLSLMASDADIVLFADNDVKYFDGYKEKAEDFYNSHLDADVVIFNFKEQRGNEPLRDVNTKDKKAKLSDLTSFGAWAISAKREKLLEKGISFSLLFGGGAKYSAGEDSLFLMDCYRKGLSVWLCSETLGTVVHRESTWFKGVSEKLLYDRGAFYAAASKRSYGFFILVHAFKHKEMYAEIGNISKIIKIMLLGAKEYLK